MGKLKKGTLLSKKNVPLEKEVTDGKVTKQRNKEKFHLRAEECPVIDSKTSRKILAAAKQQQFDLTEDNFPSLGGSKKNLIIDLKSSQENYDDGELSETEFMDDLQMDVEDAKAFQRFQNPDEGRRAFKLADVIINKIEQKQADIRVKLTDDGSLKIEDIDLRVRKMYEGVRDVMRRYRGGKVPKAFKIIPKLRNWEQILFITEPHQWSAAAMFQGTRIFSAVLSQSMAQRFYNLVLLPRIRDDLCEFKKLNMHLYNALKKALFKPAAFMKGIILPLLETGDCTLREAIIFGSIVARSSIPVLHSSACLLKICEMSYTGANSIFIRYFLEKRYALPYRVIDAAVFHFLKFENDKREMPVLWHQSLLTLIQRYKNDISSEQKDALWNLLRKKNHPKITPDIKRELQAAACRDMDMMECGITATAAPVEIYTDKDVGYEKTNE